jgi:hypothetical protein
LAYSGKSKSNPAIFGQIWSNLSQIQFQNWNWIWCIPTRHIMHIILLEFLLENPIFTLLLIEISFYLLPKHEFLLFLFISVCWIVLSSSLKITLINSRLCLLRNINIRYVGMTSTYYIFFLSYIGWDVAPLNFFSFCTCTYMCIHKNDDVLKPQLYHCTGWNYFRIRTYASLTIVYRDLKVNFSLKIF